MRLHLASRRIGTPTLIVLALICLYAGGFGLLAARAYDAHETGGAFDLGNYVQALWNAGRGQGLSLTTVPEFGPTRFAMHVEPTLFLMAPITGALDADPRFLLWLQAAVIALGGLPLYGLARRRLAGDWAALGIVVAYFLLPALESVTLFDFHAVALAPTLLLAAQYFLDRALLTTCDRRGIWLGARDDFAPVPVPPSPLRLADKPASACAKRVGAWGDGVRLQLLLSALCFLLAMGTKEDIPPHLVLFGIYLLVARRGRSWQAGLALSLLSEAWFYVAVSIVIPGSRPEGDHSAYLGFFSDLGDSPLDILMSPVQKPGRVLALLAAPDTLCGIAMLTLPLALTPFFGLPLLIVAAPAFGIALFSSNTMMHRLETYHYAAPAIPFVMLAAVDGAARLAGWLGRVGPRTLRRWPTCVVVVVVVVLASLAYHHYRGYSPLARAYHWPVVTVHDKLGTALAESIPPEAPVVAQAELVPLLARRPYVRVWTGPFDDRAEYYLLDVSHPAFTNRNGAQARLVADIAYEPSVGLIASQDGYLLLKKGAPRVPITPEFFSFILGAPPATARPVNAAFGETLQLVGFETARPATDREAEPLVTLYWHVPQDIKEDLYIAVVLLDEHGAPVGVTLFQQPATVWWPTSRWRAGETGRLLANTFPWWTGDRSSFGYGVTVVSGDDPWDVAARLPVVRSDGGAPPVDQGTVLPLVTFRRIAGIPYAD